VLVVEGSAFARTQLAKTLECDPAMAKRGAAAGGRAALAPEGWQTRVQHLGELWFTQLTAGIFDDVCLASPRMLFTSLPRSMVPDAGAVVLTEMGSDGSLRLRPLAAASGAIFGMLAARLRTGLAAAVMSARVRALRGAQAR
jgi:chemotaxis response regulator CheB